MLESFRRFEILGQGYNIRRKTFSTIEGREGHEDRNNGDGIESKNVFCLRALRVLRGDIQFLLVAAPPTLGSYVEFLISTGA